MGRVGLDAKQAVVARLRALQGSGKPITEVVRFAAASLGVDTRTVWRWIADGPPGKPGPTAWQVTDQAVRALYTAHGRPTIARRLLVDEGAEVPSQSTFCRAVREQLSRAELAYMAAGDDGRRRYSVYRRWEPEDRNDIWEADHAQLDILVSVPRWCDPIRPWLTVLIDGYSRVIMGTVLSVQPTTAEVLTAIREGIMIDEARGPWGGIPDLIRFDGGKEFLSEAVSRAAARLGFAGLPTPPYSPHLKGKVERLHRTIGEGLIASLPHYLHGPRTKSGKLFAQPEKLTIAELQAAVRNFVDDYNTGHKHRSLRGLTPAEKWDSSHRVLEILPAEQLRWMLLSDTTRIINGDGIHFETKIFIAPEIIGMGGERVEVRYMPYDLRSVEVFRRGEWLCTAFPQDQVADELADAIQRQQHALNKVLGARRAAASRERSRRLAPITAIGEIQELPKRRSAKRRPAELSDARLDAVLRLHGLDEQLNTAEPKLAQGDVDA